MRVGPGEGRREERARGGGVGGGELNPADLAVLFSEFSSSISQHGL